VGGKKRGRESSWPLRSRSTEDQPGRLREHFSGRLRRSFSFNAAAACTAASHTGCFLIHACVPSKEKSLRRSAFSFRPSCRRLRLRSSTFAFPRPSPPPRSSRTPRLLSPSFPTLLSPAKRKRDSKLDFLFPGRDRPPM